MGSGPGGADEVRNHSWFSPSWAVDECLPARVNEPGDEAYFDWTWKTLRSLSPGPFQPSLTSETDTSYFREDDIEGRCEGQLQEQPNSSSGIGEGEDGQGAPTAQQNGEASAAATGGSGCFEGNQLSFAGFTFSSPKLAPLSGVYLAPSQTATGATAQDASASVKVEPLPEKESNHQATYIQDLGKSIGLSICMPNA